MNMMDVQAGLCKIDMHIMIVLYKLYEADATLWLVVFVSAIWLSSWFEVEL